MKKINDLKIYSQKNFVTESFDRAEVLQCVLHNKRKNSGRQSGYNFLVDVDHNGFFSALYSRFFNLCSTQFRFTPAELNSSAVWAYVSDSQDFHEYWHDHSRTSTINGVYYLEVPDGHASIDFRGTSSEEVFTYGPEKNELVVFPGDLPHKPNRCYSPGYRVSINVEIICKETFAEVFSSSL